MVLTVSVALLAVISVGVSTFAWFQANANVNIETTSDSTTITVSKPDDYFFYAYNGNRASHTPTGTFSSDFTAIATSSDLSRETNLTGIHPGQSFTYCVEATNLVEGRAIDLELVKIISNDVTKQSNATYKRYRHGSHNGGNDIEINIGWAIDIYAKGIFTNGADPTGYNSDNFLTSTSYGGTDLFDYNYESTFTPTGATADPLSTGSYANNIITVKNINNDDNIHFFTDTTPENKDRVYIFYRVYFSQDDSLLYSEVDSNGDKVYVPVEDDDRYFKPYESYISSNRLYVNNVQGSQLITIDSNHYQLKNISLEVNDSLKIYNGSAYYGCKAIYEGCGYTIGETSLTSPTKNILVSEAGTYTVDYYIDAINDNHIKLTKTTNTPSDFDSNCFQGLKFSLNEMKFTF